MGRNCLIGDVDPRSLMISPEPDDNTRCIQSFLMMELKPTPRRQLFEEFEENLVKLRQQELKDIEDKKFTTDETPSRNCEFNSLKELNDFRLKHPQDCMSKFNLNKFQRTKAKEEESLKHACVYHYKLNERLIPKPVHANKHGESLCELCKEPMKESSDSSKVQTITNPIIINKSTSIRDLLTQKIHPQSKPIFLLEVNERKPKPLTKNIVRKKVQFQEDSLALKHQKRKY
ncbi:unnamed protein product [Diamesa serratosioi]